MAIIFTKERKRQRILILITALIIGGTSIVLWSGYFKKEKITPPVLVVPFKKIEINFEVLENPLLKEFRPFEKLLPFPFEDGIGRENPFVPY